MVMAATGARIHPHEHFAAPEHIGPLFEHVAVVDRDLQPLLITPHVLIARREVRREQDVAAVDARHLGQHTRHFTGRDALKVNAFGIQGAQQLGMRGFAFIA